MEKHTHYSCGYLRSNISSINCPLWIRHEVLIIVELVKLLIKLWANQYENRSYSESCFELQRYYPAAVHSVPLFQSCERPAKVSAVKLCPPYISYNVIIWLLVPLCPPAVSMTREL